MRLSRFKDRIDGGTTSTRRPRNTNSSNPNSPTKNKVSKNKNRSSTKKGKKKGVKEDDEYEKIKLESGNGKGSSASASAAALYGGGLSREGTYESMKGTPEPGLSEFDLGIENQNQNMGVVKKEPGISSMHDPHAQSFHSSASASAEASPSPSASQIGIQDRSQNRGFTPQAEMSDMDEMMASFGMPSPSMYHHSLLSEPHTQGHSHPYGIGMGMNMHTGMGDSFEGIWKPRSGMGGSISEDVLVKPEPRWEEACRRV